MLLVPDKRINAAAAVCGRAVAEDEINIRVTTDVIIADCPLPPRFGFQLDTNRADNENINESLIDEHRAPS